MNNQEYELYQTDELKHYGVLGLKWGVRRASRRDVNARAARKQYSRDFDSAVAAAKKTKYFAVTKRGKAKKAQLDQDYSDKFDKMIDSAKKSIQADSKARSAATKKMYAEKGYDRKTAERVSKMSTGKALAQTFLMGSYGALKYNQARSRGAKRGEAAAKAVLSNWANNLTLGQLSRTEQKNRIKGSKSAMERAREKVESDNKLGRAPTRKERLEKDKNYGI